MWLQLIHSDSLLQSRPPPWPQVKVYLWYRSYQETLAPRPRWVTSRETYRCRDTLSGPSEVNASERVRVFLPCDDSNCLFVCLFVSRIFTTPVDKEYAEILGAHEKM